MRHLKRTAKLLSRTGEHRECDACQPDGSLQGDCGDGGDIAKKVKAGKKRRQPDQTQALVTTHARDSGRKPRGPWPKNWSPLGKKNTIHARFVWWQPGCTRRTAMKILFSEIAIAGAEGPCATAVIRASWKTCTSARATLRTWPSLNGWTCRSWSCKRRPKLKSTGSHAGAVIRREGKKKVTAEGCQGLSWRLTINCKLAVRENGLFYWEGAEFIAFFEGDPAPEHTRRTALPI